MICARVHLTLDQRIVATSLYSIVGKTRDTRVTSLPQKPDHSNMISVSMFCRQQQRRFLVIDEAQFILVEPDTTKLGWGVVKFVARLQVGEFVCFVSFLYLLSMTVLVCISNLVTAGWF